MSKKSGNKRKKHKLEIDIMWLIIVAAIIVFVGITRAHYCSENYFAGVVYDSKQTSCYCACGTSQDCGVYDVFWDSKIQKCVSTFANPNPFSCDSVSWDSQYKKECDKKYEVLK